MLLKFLPFLQKKEKSQVPNPQQKLQKSLQSAKQNKAFEIVGLNLLSDKSNDPTLGKSKFTPENPDIITLLFKKIISFLCIVMLSIIVLNFLVIFSINYLKLKQNDLVKQIQAYSDIQTTAISVDKRTTYYKKIIAQRKNLSPKVEFISTKIGNDINVKNIKYTISTFTLFADGPDAYTLTRLIAKILEGNTVSEISIKGARINTREGRFEIDMEGKFN
jgi:hypothetical protein